MTVAVESGRASYATNGTTGPFTIPFYFLDATHLQVVHRSSAGVETTLALNTDYTVTGAGVPAGGTLTTTVAYAAGGTITIVRNVPMTQETDYGDADSFPAESHERALDKLTMIAQQHDETLARVLVLSVGSTGSAVLPDVASRANKLLGFTSDGAPAAVPSVLGTATQLALDLVSSIGATLVGFISAGTGAVARTLQSVLRDQPINVKNFGAVGDDATDDTAAIQAAINHAATFANGRVVEFPAGTYRISAPITVPNNVSLTLRGHGDATKIRRISGSGYTFDCGSASVFSTRLRIESIFFQGPVAGTSNGIRLNNCNTAVVERCVFQNQVTGIESQNSFAVELVSNVFDVCSNYGFIATTACHNAVIERNNFFTCQLQGVRFDVGSDNLRIDGNNFEFCGSNVRLNNCTAVSIEDNYIEYQSNACFEFLGTCREVYIQGNWIALGSGGGAIAALSNIVGGYFRHNTVYNQTVTTAGTLIDFEIGTNYKFGTGTMAVQNWIAPALLNSWVNQTNYVPVTYRKDSNGVVHLRGNATTGAAGTVIFNLPAGYRPGAFATFGTYGTGGASPVEVRLNGDVYVVLAPSNQCSLNGISFKAEA